MSYPKFAAVCLAMAMTTGISTIALADESPEVEEPEVEALDAMGGPNSDENLKDLLSSELQDNNGYDETEANELAEKLMNDIDNAEKNYGQGEKTLAVKTLLALGESEDFKDLGEAGLDDDYAKALEKLLDYRAEGRGWGEILRTEYGISVGDIMRSDTAKMHAQNHDHGGNPAPTLQQHSGGKPDVSPQSDRPDRPVRPEKAEKPLRPERPDRPSRP